MIKKEVCKIFLKASNKSSFMFVLINEAGKAEIQV